MFAVSAACGGQKVDSSPTDNEAWGPCEAEDPAPAIVQIAAGGHHTCALTQDGRVRCWGPTDRGVLALGVTLPECDGIFLVCDRGSRCCVGDDEPPRCLENTIQLGLPATQVAVGSGHACALLEDGTVHCWGMKRGGSLGGGDLDGCDPVDLCEYGASCCQATDTCCVGDDEHPSAVAPVSLGGKAKQIVTATKHSCALLEDGSIRCWGSGDNGVMGTAAGLECAAEDCDDAEGCCIGDDELPSAVPAIEFDAPALAIATGTTTTCALLAGGALYCWGRHEENGHAFDVGDDEVPASAGPVTTGGQVTQVTVGASHACALFDDGGARCWGTPQAETGYAGAYDNEAPDFPANLPYVDVGGSAGRIVAGNSATCAVLDSGALVCWGENASGMLGHPGLGHIGDDELPAAVDPVDIGGKVLDVTFGYAHACALLEGGAIRCWGQGWNGQLGNGAVKPELCGNSEVGYLCENDPTCCVGDDETPGSLPPVEVF